MNLYGTITVAIICGTILTGLKWAIMGWASTRGKGRARAIPKGTEGDRRGRKPRGEPKPKKPPIPTPGEPFPMD
jgi:hypothetical protein